MSFTFSIVASTAPSFAKILSRLPYDDVRYVEETSHPHPEPWPRDIVFHIYRNLISVRPVECTWTGESMEIRVLSCSCPQDYQLAIDFVTESSKQLNQPITPQEHKEVGADQFREAFERSWVDRMVRASRETVKSLVESEGTLTLPGVTRPFYLGSTLLKRLDAEQQSGWEERLFAQMRRVQYVDEEHWYIARVLAVDPPGQQPSYTLSVWGPEVDYFFAPVDRIAVMQVDDESPPILVDFEHITDLEGVEWEFADEKHLFVKGVPIDQWPELVAQARAHGTETTQESANFESS